MAHKKRSFPLASIYSIIYGKILHPDGSEPVRKVLRFMLVDETIGLEDMPRALEYAQPILQKRFSRYYRPDIQKRVDRLTDKLRDLQHQGGPDTGSNIRAALLEFSKSLTFKTGSVINRPFKPERDDWLAFKKEKN